MAISYNGLWKILIDNGMKKGDLKRRTGISSGTIAKMTNGEAVTLTVLEKICNDETSILWTSSHDNRLTCNLELVMIASK